MRKPILPPGEEVDILLGTSIQADYTTIMSAEEREAKRQKKRHAIIKEQFDEPVLPDK